MPDEILPRGEQVQETSSIESNMVQGFNEVIKQMMLSERILIDKKAAKLNTKSVDLKKSINSSLISYEMEFEYAFDTINSVM